VVGKAYDHMTPIFMSDLRSVIFRPYWEVPVSIARAEIIPAIERDPRYLKKENMELVNGRGNVVATDTITAYLLDQVRAGKLSVRQRPAAVENVSRKLVSPRYRWLRFLCRLARHRRPIQSGCRFAPRTRLAPPKGPALPAGSARCAVTGNLNDVNAIKDRC
jgi:hypothetical protein